MFSSDLDMAVMTSGGYLELSSPVQFDPVGQVTTVFYDDKNQQVNDLVRRVILIELSS